MVIAERAEKEGRKQRTVRRAGEVFSGKDEIVSTKDFTTSCSM
jgi:hypothetical protein